MITFGDNRTPCLTLALCYWCGEGKHMVMANMDIETAEAGVIIDYEPCPSCAEAFGKGVLFAEVDMEPSDYGQLPLAEGTNHYPTGRWWVVKREVVHKLIAAANTHGHHDLACFLRGALQLGKAAITEGVVTILGLDKADSN